MGKCLLALGCFALLTFASATTIEARQKPDFTGTWVAVSPAEAAGQEQEVRHTATTLSTGHASEGDGHNAIYKLDGSESRNEIMMGGEPIVTLSRANWEGNKIVITSATTYPDGQKMDTKEIWSMIVVHTKRSQ